MTDAATTVPGPSGKGETRRDFLAIATGALSVAGAGFAVWPLIHSMNPAADVLAVSSTEVDLAPVAKGQAITVVWRGKPIFIRHRTPQEIKVAQETKLSDLIDPEADGDRVQKDQWLVMVGICTHLGCIPLGQRSGDAKGEYGGWFCPCHGSHYDTSGRIRKGPAPLNLVVPEYTFLPKNRIKIG